ncbi:MAG: outer membrane lipoprotein carrier protein LolA [Geothrix sp.]|nr:outer membrane lipoprotein carrier protein LolA [Geothrix sp.]
MRRLAIVLLAAFPALASMPGWWLAFSRMPSLESRFRQESDSLVFGKLAREGRLTLARGGRLRVAYEGGLTVVCDGRNLVQYDPDTRTAQRVELARAVRDFPLLGILLDPARLERLYRVESLGGEALKLAPREPGLPELKATGRRGLLRTLEWTDPTGARQKLELLDPKSPVPLAPGTFRLQVPAGTRWATPNG